MFINSAGNMAGYIIELVKIGLLGFTNINFLLYVDTFYTFNMVTRYFEFLSKYVT